VDVRTHDTVDAFLGAATAFLAADETRHNLAFGICSTLAETPDAYPSFRGWTAEDGAEVVGAALITPPFNLVVAQPRDDGALESLAHGLRRNAAELPGATGALPEVEQFAATWARLTRARARLHSRQGIYRLGSVREFPRVPGAMRSARPSERKLLEDWFDDFQREALGEARPRQDVARNVDRRLGSESGGIVLWEDDEPVSLAGYGGRTPSGIRIGPVYTPPHARRRGYASALVAQLSQKLLDGGRSYCFLYTDLANPTANRIYQRIGYEFACESAEYAFASPGS
jgi:GNAT superfamily N-acetyltransferase